MYKSLQLVKITDTLDTLEARIAERFADCGLFQVCRELKGLTASSAERIAWILKPNWALRAGVLLVIAACIGSGVWGIRHIHLRAPLLHRNRLALAELSFAPSR